MRALSVVHRAAAPLLLSCLVASGCTVEGDGAPAPAAVTTTITPTVAPATTTGATKASTTTSTTTSTTSTTTSTTSTTSTTLPQPDPLTPALRVAFARLSGANSAASITVLRDRAPFLRLASGSTLNGSAVTTDTPMVIASVSKIVTALTVARLVQRGDLATDAVVPWGAMGFVTDPGWDTVTVRDLLDHTSGMPIARKAWLDDPGSCAIPLAGALAAPPRPERGTWVYSNGNYCALGLLIEHVTGARFDAAAADLVFAPGGITGPHLSVDGAAPGDAPYATGVARFDRLGAAGQWLASTDDIAAMLDAVTGADRQTLQWPGVFTDQYGWGHTGTVDGAASCAWVIESDRTVVVATTAGPFPGSGGGICDLVLPAAAADLGLPYLGEPVRTPE